jgi:hypothetical protein
LSTASVNKAVDNQLPIPGAHVLDWRLSRAPRFVACACLISVEQKWGCANGFHAANLQHAPKTPAARQSSGG